jgi:hydrogenase small subunit
MSSQLNGPLAGLLDRGITRRAFLQFCAATTALLALPASYAPRVAAAVARAPRVPLVWLRGAGCGGDSEAFLRAANPGIDELLLDLLSVDYFETLMAPAGTAADASRSAMRAQFPNGYIAIIEGAISTIDDGVFHTVGGRPFRDVVREVCDGAAATIAVGSCAFDGGLAAATGGSIDAVGVAQVTSNPRFVALPGCPVNVANLTATIVHYLTFKSLPPADPRGRPLFAYGSLLHNQCERRPHFEFGEFVLDWGDEGAQKGWCLYKMGCKGPETFANCASVRYDVGTSWPVQAGHGCIGCTMPGFWDSMSPVFARLPPWLPFNPDVSADAAGIALVGGVGALAMAHGAASIVRARLGAASERRLGSAVLVAPDVATERVSSAAVPGDTSEVATASPAAVPAAADVLETVALEPVAVPELPPEPPPEPAAFAVRSSDPFPAEPTAEDT